VVEKFLCQGFSLADGGGSKGPGHSGPRKDLLPLWQERREVDAVTTEKKKQEGLRRCRGGYEKWFLIRTWREIRLAVDWGKKGSGLPRKGRCLCSGPGRLAERYPLLEKENRIVILGGGNAVWGGPVPGWR